MDEDSQTRDAKSYTNFCIGPQSGLASDSTSTTFTGERAIALQPAKKNLGPLRYRIDTSRSLGRDLCRSTGLALGPRLIRPVVRPDPLDQFSISRARRLARNLDFSENS